MNSTIRRDCSLAQYNTLGLDVKCRYFAQVTTREELDEALRFARRESQRLFVLGEGSNVLFRDDFDGLILRMGLKGISLETTEDGAVVTAAAGENWHLLVESCLARGLYGLENLALIPGSVGAAPVQNIGAYGAELEQVLAGVEVIDRESLSAHTMTPGECRFGYRHSIFREEAGAGRVITAVRLRLSNASELNLSYAPVREELAAMGVTEPGGREIAEAVCRIRRRRLPDPARVGNVGSFFKNPVVTAEVAESLRRVHPALPASPTDAGLKLSAAWLIEQCGLKGSGIGGAAVSDQHALVLVNRGGATPADFLELAEQIRSSVAERFGVGLELEPTLC